jgi:hypothetical protein
MRVMSYGKKTLTSRKCISNLLWKNSAFFKLLIPHLSLILAQGNESTHKIAIRYLKHARPVPKPPLKWLVRLADKTDYTLRRETAHTSQKTGSTAVLKLQA